ncbi:MAG: MBL fold metallo-hydrolase [SAR202 cluster bacterium]|nr:MBL fold metallo-hydrolase [SAR202 cluster bacterium]
MNVLFQRGVYLPEPDLWLDSTLRRASAFISHAHADHVGPHSRPILSQATGVLLQDRLRRADPCVMHYGEPLDTPGYTLTLYPAGHCLGSAQVLIESKADGHRTLYTGDFKAQPNPTAQPLQPVQCDTLIMECTFGQPVYRFPPQHDVLELLFQTLKEWLEKGYAPVILAYKTGKAQELLYQLLAKGFSVAMEESAYTVTRRYEEAGIQFPGAYSAFDGALRDGEVAISPPGRKSREALQGVKRKGFLALSGWAVHPRGGYQLNADVTLPYSDHADFDDLVDYVKASGARKVYTVSGFEDLAVHLRSLGFQAEHLTNGHKNTQLTLL